MSNKRIKNLEEIGSSTETFSQAVEALKRGEIIVFPTETFYGLGADALDKSAVERVVSLKGRDPESPIPIIIANEEMLKSVVTDPPAAAQKLIDHFWPGPLTLVLPAKKDLPAPLFNRDGAVGLRISSHPLATRLAHELGHPLTATSANPSGQQPARTIEEARGYFSGKVEIFIDRGRLVGKKGSTVVAIMQDEVRIIREGEISSEEIERVLAAKD